MPRGTEEDEGSVWGLCGDPFLLAGIFLFLMASDNDDCELVAPLRLEGSLAVDKEEERDDTVLFPALFLVGDRFCVVVDWDGDDSVDSMDEWSYKRELKVEKKEATKLQQELKYLCIPRFHHFKGFLIRCQQKHAVNHNSFNADAKSFGNWIHYEILIFIIILIKDIIGTW